MLDRQNREGARLTGRDLRRVFSQQVQQAKSYLSQQGIPALYVDYRETVTHPARVAGRVKDFLGGSIEAEAMADVVDPDLYRQRTDEGKNTP
jgi:hypothetical protein